MKSQEIESQAFSKLTLKIKQSFFHLFASSTTSLSTNTPSSINRPPTKTLCLTLIIFPNFFPNLLARTFEITLYKQQIKEMKLYSSNPSGLSFLGSNTMKEAFAPV